MRKYLYKYREPKILKFYDDYVYANSRAEAVKIAQNKIKKFSKENNKKYSLLYYTLRLYHSGDEKTYTFRFKKWAARSKEIAENYNVYDDQYIKADSCSQAVAKAKEMFGRNNLIISSFQLVHNIDEK